MRVVYTNKIPEFISPQENLWIYNGLDNAVTHEVGDVLERDLKTQQSDKTYNFTLGMMAPAFQMMIRGIKINLVARDKLREELSATLLRLELLFNRICTEVAGRSFNSRSPAQLKELFYTFMGIPPIEIFDYTTKEKKISVNREALEKLRAYYYAQPLANTILAMRDVEKKLQVLKSGVDSDGRMRCSYNVVGTETGRWSSSKNAFNRGTNNQNITDEMREIFIPDEGMKLAYLDLEQAESRAVAYISGDPAYIAACNSGDLHTAVCRLIWKDLPWTGELGLDKAIAERLFYRHFSHRDLAKRGGHASNYYAKPHTISHHLHIPREIAERFQQAYFSAYPLLSQWHQKVAMKLGATSSLTTLLGRKRLFFSRPRDDKTLREAIAYEPQSCVGDILNIGLWRVWKHLDPKDCQILGQVHDAILLQYKEEDELRVLTRALSLMRVEVPTPHGTMTIPTEAAVGWNWRKAGKDGINFWGLKKFNGKPDTRKRPEGLKKTSMLDRLVCSVN